MYFDFITAHTVNEPAATYNNMNSSDVAQHPPSRPPPARPPSTPHIHPDPLSRPQPPSRPSSVPPRPSPVHQSPPRSQQQIPPHNQSRSQQSMHLTPQAGSGGGLFSSLRGGAGNFLKNLKDTTGKVMQTVQQ